ncbi:MAG: DciA family protein [Rhodobacteraceae bacterium]|nr:DciA family protein [Paracoccaceae bacterium]
MQGNTRKTSGKDRRFGRGFTHAAALVETRIQKTGGARGFAQMRLLTHWNEIAGAEIARISRPLKISYARQGLGARLTLLAKPAHAPELQMQLPRLKERVNASYGYRAIADIRITQSGDHAGFAEPQHAFKHDQPAPELPAKQAKALAGQVADVEDQKLRALLESLGKNIMLTSKGPPQ